MNALDLLHKSRTVGPRGMNFVYTDTEVLNDLIELIQSAEAGAREIAIEQHKREVDFVSGILSENRDMAIKALADAKDTICALLKAGGAFDVASTLEEIDSAICCLEQTTSA